MTLRAVLRLGKKSIIGTALQTKSARLPANHGRLATGRYVVGAYHRVRKHIAPAAFRKVVVRVEELAQNSEEHRT